MAHQRLRFEVFGKVQRVFFRKFTAEKATTLGLRGWCKNQPHGTVVGEAVGPPDAIAQFQHWLRHEGSPQSQISDAKLCPLVGERSSPSDGPYHRLTEQIRATGMDAFVCSGYGADIFFCIVCASPRLVSSSPPLASSSCLLPLHPPLLLLAPPLLAPLPPPHM